MKQVKGALIQYLEGKPITGRVPLEEEEQIALFDWARAMKLKIPQLEMLIATPNGGLRPYKIRYDKSGVSHRYSVESQKLARQGVSSGYPDLQLNIPIQRTDGTFCGGLFIELKRIKGGVISPEQKAWIEKLRKWGYEAVVCKGFDAAKQAIIDYLAGKALKVDGFYFSTTK